MLTERRKHARIAVPVDGRWLGNSGGRPARWRTSASGDASCGRRRPRWKASGVLRLMFGRKSLSIAGRIVHAERGRGFGLKFQDVSPDVRRELAGHLEDLKSALVA